MAQQMPNLGASLLPMDDTFAKTPEQQAANAQGWKGFLERFKTDPSLQAGVLQMGLSMMQPVAPGQTGGGHVASSLSSGLNQMALIESARRKKALEDANEQRENKKLQTNADYMKAIGQAQTDIVGINRDKLGMQAEENAATADFRKQQLELERRQFEEAAAAAEAARRRTETYDSFTQTGGEKGVLATNLAGAFFNSGKVKTIEEGYIMAMDMLQRGASSGATTKEEYLLQAPTENRAINAGKLPHEAPESIEDTLQRMETVWNTLHPPLLEEGKPDPLVGQTFQSGGVTYQVIGPAGPGEYLAEAANGGGRVRIPAKYLGQKPPQQPVIPQGPGAGAIERGQ